MTDFAERLLDWFDHSGRKHLPWQQAISPYRVWVSEIMLQQTQVATVIPYFERFMATFPEVSLLASAQEDQVLHLWTGLGYYARARNLHRAAKQVVADYDGEFPNTVEALCELPGIGRSTAGAIVSIACGGRAAILDGNVKRVLARHEAIAGWPGSTAVSRALWARAEDFTPERRVADYTQAIMDLGATVCTRSSPRCEQCPVAATCQARSMGDIRSYPGKKPKRETPQKERFYPVVVDDDHRLLLVKRPAQGVWGGLWCLPEFESREASTAWAHQAFDIGEEHTTALPAREHALTHFHLTLRPLLMRIPSASAAEVREPLPGAWFDLHQPLEVGLPAPLASMITELRHLCDSPRD